MAKHLKTITTPTTDYLAVAVIAVLMSFTRMKKGQIQCKSCGLEQLTCTRGADTAALAKVKQS